MDLLRWRGASVNRDATVSVVVSPVTDPPAGSWRPKGSTVRIVVQSG